VNVGSLFTGIGGIDLGLERAGMRVAWQCEADDYCRAVLAKHWPNVPCLWDKPNAAPYGGAIAPNLCEFVLFARTSAWRGTGRLSGSVFRALKGSQHHSRKPDAFLDMVEQVSPGPYLEMFARRQRLGWDTWGDQALNHVGRFEDTA
jgi:hypothetical protein